MIIQLLWSVLVSCRATYNSFHHSLVDYLWSLDSLFRSRCHFDNVLKSLPYARFARELILPNDSVFTLASLVIGNSSGRPFYIIPLKAGHQENRTARNFGFLMKLRNESLSVLFEVLYASVLKIDVTKRQLHFDTDLITSAGAQKELEARRDFL